MSTKSHISAKNVKIRRKTIKCQFLYAKLEPMCACSFLITRDYNTAKKSFKQKVI